MATTPEQHNLPAPPADPIRPEWGKSPPSDDSERKFLSGPADRSSELLRTLRIGWVFLRGFRKLHWVGPCVTVFGDGFTETAKQAHLALNAGCALILAVVVVVLMQGFSRRH